MNTKALRQKILDLAIHGKLVPQDPNDEPASVLLERIRAEKERLIKEGKIKRPKKTKATSDKPHYPYELPEGWVWCKLYDIVEFIGGYAYKSNTYVSKSDYQVVRIGNVKNDFLNLENLPVFVPETIGNQTDKYRIYENDILFTMTGTKGKRDYFFTTVVKKQERILLLNQRVGCLRSFSTELNMNYLSMLLKGKYILDSIFSTETGNVSQGNIGSENTLNLFVALPPYVEQQRIVKKVNSFFDLLNVMEERKRNLQDCIHDIKVKILDLAIQGKLIPQDSTDEPACDLLKRINPKAEITCDNGHYQKLPKGWAVCQLDSIISYEQPTPYIVKSTDYNDTYTTPVLTAGKSFIIGHTNETNGIYEKLPCIIFDDFTTDSKLVDFPFKVKSSAMKILQVKEDINIEYIAIFMSITRLIGDTHKRYWISEYSKIEIPIPPQNEQDRIVKKVRLLLSRLDEIMENL